jgi:DNA-binding PadR family transcriptional regulator
MRAHPEDFLPLTPGFFEILLTLSAGEAHGYAIMQQVTERTAGQVRLLPGTMYRAFNRLQEQRLIEETGERPDATVDDQRRRYYRLTDLGRDVAAAEARRLSASLQFAADHDLLGESDS